MRSSLTSLARRLPELTSDLAMLADMIDGNAPDTLDKARTVVDKAVVAICKEERIAIDAYTPVDKMLDLLVERQVLPEAVATQVRQVHAHEVTLVGDAVRAVVGFLEWRVGSRSRIVYQPPSRSSRRMVFGLVAAIAVVGALIAYVARPRTKSPIVTGAPTVKLVGGTFEMGSHDDELAAALALCTTVEHRQEIDCRNDADELAQEQLRTVTIAPFELDRHEVTVGDYVVWLGREPPPPDQIIALPNVDYDREHDAFTAAPDRETMPVTGVTWNQARAYCEAIGARLPTDAEWEFAARGVERRLFPWGSELPTCRDVVYARTANQACDRAGPWSNDPVAVETAAKDVTPDGIHDLGGNVSEWVADAAGARPRCSGPCENPRTDGDVTAKRVLRGGNWMGWIGWMRGAARSVRDPDTARTNVGFRCAR